MKKSVTIRYERAVMVGSESAQYQDILFDLGMLVGEAQAHRAYRLLYGGRDAEIGADLKSLERDISIYGQPLLVVDPVYAGDVPEGQRAWVPSEAAAELNKAVRNGKVPKEQAPFGREFTADDLTQGKDGSFPVINKKSGESAAAAMHTVFGGYMQPVTGEDLAGISKALEAAGRLGIDPKDLLSLIRPNASKIKAGNLAADWEGDPLPTEEAPVLEADDPLRTAAPRPGGENYALVRGAPSILHDYNANSQKDDNYAVIRIASGFLPGSGDPLQTGHDFKVEFQTNRFLVESASEGEAEKMSIVETFGEPYLYLFGRRARIWSYSGVLLDTVGLNWLNEWREAYRTKMRGSESMKLKARAFMIYRDVAREGFIVANMNSVSVAEFGTARFSFQMFIIREYFLDGAPNVGSQAGVKLEVQGAGPQADALLNYSPTIIDVTPQTRERRPDPADGLPQLRTFQTEDEIAAKKAAEIRSKILSAAFRGGKYVCSAGHVDVPLAAVELQEATEQFIKRSAEDADVDLPDIPPVLVAPPDDLALSPAGDPGAA